MTQYLNNFCDGSPVSVCAAFSDNPAIGPTVSIVQSVDSMSFQHTMRPSQARELSAMLLSLANEAEQLEVEHQREKVVV